MCVTNAECILSVSYTHLDVYKRQTVNCMNSADSIRCPQDDLLNAVNKIKAVSANTLNELYLIYL